MSTATERPRRPGDRRPGSPGALSSLGATGSALLARPLASYYLVLGSAGLLCVIGLVMVLSASSITAITQGLPPYYYFLRQLIGVVLGLAALAVAMRLPLRTYRFLGYPLLLLAVFLLAAVLVPGIGDSHYGARRWFDLGPIQVQPSEPAKLALVLWGADLLSRKQKLIHRWRHLLVPLLPAVAIMAGLVMLEPDMGTTIVLLSITLALLWVIGAPAKLFALLTGTVVALGSVMIAIEPYRLRRFTGFLDPWADATHTGYQSVQGLLALSSGGWFGLGLGASRAKWSYLPNPYTDYIFAILGEELGLVGTLVVLTLFGTLGYAGIRIARRTRDPFCRLAAAGITGWLMSQALVNMGAVLGVLPITGIPLPLMSYGVSALVPTLFAVGILAALARAEPGAAAALAARRSARPTVLPARRPLRTGPRRVRDARRP